METTVYLIKKIIEHFVTTNVSKEVGSRRWEIADRRLGLRQEYKMQSWHHGSKKNLKVNKSYTYH